MTQMSELTINSYEETGQGLVYPISMCFLFWMSFTGEQRWLYIDNGIKYNIEDWNNTTLDYKYYR